MDQESGRPASTGNLEAFGGSGFRPFGLLAVLGMMYDVVVASVLSKCPGKMSYLLAEHQLKDVPDTATLERAFGRFMAYQMSVCLGLRENGLGTWREVPTWTVIDELRIGNAKINGPACIRRALKYI